MTVPLQTHWSMPRTNWNGHSWPSLMLAVACAQVPLHGAAQNELFNMRLDPLETTWDQTGHAATVAGDGSIELFLGSYYFYGTVGLENIETARIARLKLSTQGSVLDQHVIAGSNSFSYLLGAGSVAPAGNGHVLLSRFSHSMITPRYQLTRIDAAGDTLWKRDGLGPFVPSAICTLPNDDIIVVGSTSPPSIIDGVVLHMNSDGLNLNIIPSGVEGIDRYTCIIPLEAGSFMVGGAAEYAAQVTRYNEDGSVAWTWTDGSGTNGVVERLRQVPDGMIVAFCTYGPAGRLVMIDPLTGSELWSSVVGADLLGYTMEGGSVLADGSLICYGNQGGGMERRVVVERCSPTGIPVWRQYYSYALDDGSQGPVSISDLVVIPTQDLLMVGTAHAVGQGWTQLFDQDAWLMKVDQNGCLVPGCNGVGITDHASDLLNTLRIVPNPAQGQCIVQVEFPHSMGTAPLLLTVLAPDGRVLRRSTLPGKGQYSVDLHGISAGLYSMHVSQGGRWLAGTKLVVQ